MNERKDFEEWASSEGYEIERWGADVYMHWETNDAWQGWQARAKLMLTLPVKDATGEH